MFNALEQARRIRNVGGAACCLCTPNLSSRPSFTYPKKMPQKFRQRGKKKKSSNAEHVEDVAETAAAAPQQDWQQEDYLPLEDGGAEAEGSQSGQAIQHTPLEHASGDFDADVAPFGFVPPELKSYLKDAHANLQRLDSEAQEYGHRPTTGAGDADEEEGDERTTLRLAMLREMDGQELACATDGESSVILEAILSGLDERRLRILADRMSGSCATLASHRFGSHVLQAVLRGLQQSLVSSSRKGKGKASVQGQEGSTGVLRTAEELIRNITEEVIPDAQSLVQATFATHVIRSLLLLLSGHDISADTNIRSKKSAAFRNKAVAPEQGKGKENGFANGVNIPSFPDLLASLREACVPQDSTGRNEVRALLMSASASPTFALLLSLEAQAGESVRPNSLADVVFEGMISDPASTQSKDGVETLLRHPSGSHALEGILTHATSEVADRFIATYAKGKMVRLGSHPVANFVLSKAIKRARASTVKGAIEDVRESGGSKMVKDAKTGLFLAFLERTAGLEDKELQKAAVEVILASFGFDEDLKAIVAKSENCALLFQSILSLKTRSDFKKMIKRRKERAAKDAEVPEGERKKRKRDEGEQSELRDEEVSVQGSVLLQTLLKTEEPLNDVVFKALDALETPLLYAQNPTSSHVYLCALSSPTSSFLQRRTLIRSLLPILPSLADAKYSSRISDLVFSRADPFLKEKILKGIAEEGQERFLQSSFYGRFFLKRIGWAQWRKDAYAWKDWVKTLTPEPMADKLGHELQREQQPAGINGEDDAPCSKKSKRDRKAQTKEQAELDQILSGL